MRMGRLRLKDRAMGILKPKSYYWKSGPTTCGYPFAGDMVLDMYLEAGWGGGD